MKRSKVLLLIGISLGLVIAVYYIGIKAAKNISQALYQANLNSKLDSNTYSNSLPIEYANLFKNRFRADTIRTDFSKRRNAISEINYNKKLYILIYKIDTTGIQSIKSLVTPETTSNPVLSHENYVGYQNDSPFGINFKERGKPSISKVFFRLYGDQMQSFEKNDSTLYCYSAGAKYF